MLSTYHQPNQIGLFVCKMCQLFVLLFRAVKILASKHRNWLSISISRILNNRLLKSKWPPSAFMDDALSQQVDSIVYMPPVQNFFFRVEFLPCSSGLGIYRSPNNYGASIPVFTFPAPLRLALSLSLYRIPTRCPQSQKGFINKNRFWPCNACVHQL